MTEELNRSEQAASAAGAAGEKAAAAAGQVGSAIAAIDFAKYGDLAKNGLLSAGTMGLSAGEVGLKWAPTLVLLVFLGMLGKQAFEYAQTLWRESKANEWLLVMREGQMVKCGIGLQTWVMPQDQTVTFPSLINEVNFTAA
jgi:hypothetical protein